MSNRLGRRTAAIYLKTPRSYGFWGFSAFGAHGEGSNPRPSAYKTAALPLCYAGIGVADGDRTRRDGFTARRVHQFTTTTIKLIGGLSRSHSAIPSLPGKRPEHHLA